MAGADAPLSSRPSSARSAPLRIADADAAAKFLENIPMAYRNNSEFIRWYMSRHLRRKSADSPLLLICPLQLCEGSSRQRCPAHCSNVSCPVRGKGADRLPWLQENMKVVHSLLPAHPRPINPQERRLLLVTVTYPHRATSTARASGADASARAERARDRRGRRIRTQPRSGSALRTRAQVETVHLAHGPTRRGGNAQRNVAPGIRDQRLDGVVYNPMMITPTTRWCGTSEQSDRTGGRACRAAQRAPPPKCDGRFLNLRNAERYARLSAHCTITQRAVSCASAGWCREGGWLAARCA